MCFILHTSSPCPHPSSSYKAVDVWHPYQAPLSLNVSLHLQSSVLRSKMRKQENHSSVMLLTCICLISEATHLLSSQIACMLCKLSFHHALTGFAGSIPCLGGLIQSKAFSLDKRFKRKQKQKHTACHST